MSAEADQRPRRTFSGGLSRLVGLLGAAAVLVAIGFYAALFTFQSQAGPSVSTYQKGQGEKKIAILPVEGMIDGEVQGFVHEAVQAILDNDQIEAVVLRVESPGGAVTASDEILQEVKRLQEEGGLPVVASYGGYAASGGYYVSCHADRIFAQPTTVTASIGVVIPSFTAHELLNKIGIEPKVITSENATKKDLASPLRPWNEQDRQKVLQMANHIQQRFETVVANGRADQMSEQQVHEVADGAGLMADEALEAKLIDEIGYLSDAIAEARKRGDFEKDHPPVVRYSPRAGLSQLLGLGRASQQASLRIDGRTVRRWLQELTIPRAMYLYRP